jgi:hypothetical protein
LRVSKAPSPHPLFPLCRQNTSTIRDLLRGPYDALIYFLRFLRFLRNDLSVNTSDWGRWLDQVKDAPARSKSSSRLHSSAPLNHITELFDNPPTMGRETLVWGDCACPWFSDSGDDLQDPPARSCARSVIRARRSQCGVPQLALRAYPDDRLLDRGGARPRFVERGYPPQNLSLPSQSLYMDMAMVMIREKGVPRDGAMGGSVGSARPSKSDADPRSRPPYICDPCENAYTEAERQRATAQAASAIRQAPTAMIERRPSIIVVPFLRSPIDDTREFRRALTSTV